MLVQGTVPGPCQAVTPAGRSEEGLPQSYPLATHSLPGCPRSAQDSSHWVAQLMHWVAQLVGEAVSTWGHPTWGDKDSRAQPSDGVSPKDTPSILGSSHTWCLPHIWTCQFCEQ